MVVGVTTEDGMTATEDPTFDDNADNVSEGDRPQNKRRQHGRRGTPARNGTQACGARRSMRGTDAHDAGHAATRPNKARADTNKGVGLRQHRGGGAAWRGVWKEAHHPTGGCQHRTRVRGRGRPSTVRARSGHAPLPAPHGPRPAAVVIRPAAAAEVAAARGRRRGPPSRPAPSARAQHTAGRGAVAWGEGGRRRRGGGRPPTRGGHGRGGRWHRRRGCTVRGGRQSTGGPSFLAMTGRSAAALPLPVGPLKRTSGGWQRPCAAWGRESSVGPARGWGSNGRANWGVKKARGAQLCKYHKYSSETNLHLHECVRTKRGATLRTFDPP